MGPALWMRLRRWLAGNRPSADLEQVFVDYGQPGEPRVPLRSASRRELLHPMQGWREEPQDRGRTSARRIWS